MFCTSCGKEIADNSKFCPGCGHAFAAPAPAPVTAPAPASPKKPGKLLIVLAAVVAVILIAVIVFLCVYNTPALKVSRAFAKTAAAYNDVMDDLHVFDAAKLQEEKAYNASFSFELSDYEDLYSSGYEDVPAADAPAAEDYYDEYYDEYYYDYDYGTTSVADSIPTGLGVRVEAAVSLPNQDMTMRLTPFYNSIDLTSVEAGFQGNYAFLRAEDILGSDSYGLDTTTLGKVLADYDAIAPEYDTLGFNIFNLMEIAEKASQVDPEVEKAIADAAQELLAAVTMEKGKSNTIKVNGESTKCSVYKVIVPQDAIEDYLHAVEKAMKQMEYDAVYEELFAAMGLSEDTVEELMYESGLDSVSDVYDDTFDSLNDFVDELEDLEVDVYISKGYVAAIKTEITAYDEDMEVEIYLGGGDNYVDDLSMAMTMEGETLLISSSGNHSGKGGTYTDELVVEFDDETLMEAAFSYTPKSGEITVEADVEDVSITAEGLLNMEKNSFLLELEDVTLRQDDVMEVSIALSCGMSEYAPLVEVGSPLLVLEMSEEELQELVLDLEDDVLAFAEKMNELAPELVEMLAYM